MQYNYEWDRLKAKLNLSKHGVDFKEACKVFDDPMAITLFDDEESTPEEDRWVNIGQAQGHYYLVVAHTFRNPTEDAVTIRLISARPATKHEIRQYEQG